MELKKSAIMNISRESSNYPNFLKEIPDAPSEIYVLGNIPKKRSISIVGTRKASLSGRSIAKEIASKFSKRGMVIVSGLAMGIDTAAHEGALAAKGQTVAVLAHGLDFIYPHQNENLAKKIVENGGAIISEYPIGTPALPHRFLERNRIISGLSMATIIIEAPMESGALVTARLAAEQGREVFVFPGPVNHPNYHGSHKLIRDGARLVSSIDDILEDLDFSTKYENDMNIRNYENSIDDKKQLLILRTIQEAGQPISIDKIIELTKLEPQITNQAIALLMVEGIIKETEKGYAI